MANENRKSPDENPAADAAAAAPGVPDVSFPAIGDDSDNQPEKFLGDFETREEAEAFIRDAKTRLDGIDDWRKEQAEREQRYQDTINRLISTSAGTGQPAQQQSPQDDFSKLVESLPDPVEKPDEFKRALGSTLARVAGTVREHSVSQDRSRALSEFQTKFTDKHADLAKFAVIRDAALNGEADRLRQAGSDPYQAYASDPDGFMDRVAARTRQTLTEMGVDPAPAHQPDPALEAGKPPANRTGGIPGAGGKMNGAAPAPGVTSFVAELKKQQLASGFF